MPFQKLIAKKGRSDLIERKVVLAGVLDADQKCRVLEMAEPMSLASNSAFGDKITSSLKEP